MDGNQPVYPFFDRFANTEETNVLSSTTWNNYSSGAMQCAMRLTVTKVKGDTGGGINDQTPTMLEFEYYPRVGDRISMLFPLEDNAVLATLPTGFEEVCTEGVNYNFDTLAEGNPVDVAYGSPEVGWVFRYGISGTHVVNNDMFPGSNVVGGKKGYYRPRPPFGRTTVNNGGANQPCVAVYPERFHDFLEKIDAITTEGAAGTDRNHSLVVNLDYTNTAGNPAAEVPLRPQIDPCLNNDIGLVLQECADLTSFTKGFSLVSNLRLYFGDDFNVEPITAGGSSMPPCSLFAPEKRYGVEVTPTGITLSGQVGSLAQGSKVEKGDEIKEIRPLESKTMTGDTIASDSIEVNLSKLDDPSELPPVTMMNWLVLIEERRSELYETP